MNDKNLKASSSGMACPRCGGPVAVGTNPVLVHFGLIGMLLQYLTTSYSCPACGPIKFREFPDEFRSRSRWNTVLTVVIGVLAIVGLIALLVWMNT